MKYIRTKDENNLIIDLTNMVLPYNLTDKYVDFNKFGMFKIVKQADTIEELCDEFVCEETHHLLRPMFRKFGDDGYTTETYHQGIINAIKSGVNYKDYHWFGAIWTNKGLIYVAKINEKGELELL